MNIFKLRTLLRNSLVRIVQRIWNLSLRIYGTDIDKTVVVERNVSVDRWYPYGVHVGKYILLAAGVEIAAHILIVLNDKNKMEGEKLDTYIGKNCIIGTGVKIRVGVRIGDEVIVGTRSVVTKNVSSRCIVEGNPARVIRENIKLIGMKL